MNIYAKIGILVRAGRKQIHPNLKEAAHIICIGERKLWEIENGVGKLSPDEMNLLGRTVDPTIPRLYCNEICPIGCERAMKIPDTPGRFAEAVLSLSQSYKRTSQAILEKLPDIGEDGKIDGDELRDLEQCMGQLNDLMMKIELLKLRVEMETKEKVASAKSDRKNVA